MYSSLLHPLLRHLRDLVPLYLKKNVIAVKLRDSASTVANLVTSLSNAFDCRPLWKRNSLTLVLIPPHHFLYLMLPSLFRLHLQLLFWLLSYSLWKTLHLRDSGNGIFEDLSCHTIDHVTWVEYPLSFSFLYISISVSNSGSVSSTVYCTLVDSDAILTLFTTL